MPSMKRPCPTPGRFLAPDGTGHQREKVVCMYDVSLFSVDSIHTIGGASAAVLLIVQLLKDLPGLRRIPTKLLALVVGEALFLAITTPLPTTSVGWAVLLLNGVLAASVAIGGWHIVRRLTPNDKKKEW